MFWKVHLEANAGLTSLQGLGQLRFAGGPLKVRRRASACMRTHACTQARASHCLSRRMAQIISNNALNSTAGLASLSSATHAHVLFNTQLQARGVGRAWVHQEVA